MVRGWITAALCLVFWTTSASWADPQDSDGALAGEDVVITGEWSFETAQYDAGCQMTGSLTLSEGQTPGIYEGELTTLEYCPYYPQRFGEGFPGFRTRQATRAAREGVNIVLRSEIISVEPNLGNYWPDNFVLEIRSSDLMEGHLRSADIAPVKFFRANPQIS